MTVHGALLTSGLLLGGCADWRNATQPTAEFGGKMLVGYAVANQQQLFTNAAVRDFIFPNITHVVLLGATGFDSNGVVTVKAAYITNAVTVTHAKHRKISATFAGPYQRVFASQTARATLVTNVLQACRNYRLDGTDFDFEYPANMTDRTNWEMFLKELRHSAPQGLLISVAVSAWNNAKYLVPAGASAELDWIFLMGYGPSPYRMKFENNVKELQNCITWGVPASKLVLGLPIYGCRQRPDGKGEDGPSYAQILGTNVLYRTVDEFRGWHFNGPATIEKQTHYVHEKGMACVGWWYLTCDTLDEKSLTFTAANTLRAVRSPR